MNKQPKIIVITGAESTGKSTLTKALAQHFNSPSVSETARTYIENINRKYTYDDVEIITRKHINRLDELKKENHNYIFVDTWLIILKVWFEVVFNKPPDWLIESISKIKIDQFLLCDTDLPWIPDPVRENGGKNRLILQKKYIDNLKNYQLHYNLISGTLEQRIKKAVQIIELLK